MITSVHQPNPTTDIVHDLSCTIPIYLLAYVEGTMNHLDSAAMRLFPIQREGWELSLYECPNCQGSIQAIVTDDGGTPTAYPCRHQLPTKFPE